MSLAPKNPIQDEHLTVVTNLARAAGIGLVIWMAFGLVDVFVVFFVHPGRLWIYGLLRAIESLILVIGIVRLRRKSTPSAREVLFWDTMIFTGGSVCITVSCLESGGIGSPLAAGIMTILAARFLIVPTHWRLSLIPIGITFLAFPVTFLVLSIFLPSVRAQFAVPSLLGHFLLSIIFIFGTAVLTLLGSHKIWALRRKIYESKIIGRYKLKQRIGVGGMGEVWAATRSDLRREVAIKIMRPEIMTEQTRSRFDREAQVTSTLSHPNTIRVFDYGVTEDGIYYYVMELLEGESLGHLVKREKRLSPLRATQIILQAANALAEAHARKIVHRDIKPGNLFIMKAGLDANIVKLLDFGIVRVLNPLEANSEDLTMGEWIGTPHFLAPENFLGDRADLRSDIYALGLVFYLLLTGKQPLASHDINRLISLRLKHPEPPPPSTLVPSVPKELDAIVLRCLQRDPNTRYQDAGELMSALTSVMNTHLGSSNAPRVVIRPEGVDQTDQRAAPEGEKSLGDTNTTQAPERAQNSDGRAGPMPSPDSPTMNDQPTKKDDKPLADLPTHILEDEEQDDTVIER